MSAAVGIIRGRRITTFRAPAASPVPAVQVQQVRPCAAGLRQDRRTPGLLAGVLGPGLNRDSRKLWDMGRPLHHQYLPGFPGLIARFAQNEISHGQNRDGLSPTWDRPLPLHQDSPFSLAFGPTPAAMSRVPTEIVREMLSAVEPGLSFDFTPLDLYFLK